jgi:hypothetical protein
MKRKWILALLALTAASCAVFGIAGCSSCNNQENREEAHAHTLTQHTATSATCTTAGNKAYYTCNGCDEWFSDSNGTTAIADHTSVTIAKLGHDYATTFTVDKEATCLAVGSKSKHCSRCDSTTEVTSIDKIAHTEATDAAVPATCTETGLTAGKHCSTCGETIVAQKETSALGHDWDAGTITKEATCTETGVLTKTCKNNSTHTQSEPTEIIAHHYVDNVCTECHTARVSEGLRYVLNSAESGYTVYFGACTDTEVIIPKIYTGLPVTTIGKEAFCDKSSLTSVVIPDSVTSIEDSAFSGCSGLTTLTIPDTVTSIGSNAFRSCTSLKSLTIGNGVTTLPLGLLYGCSSLEEITIPFVGESISATTPSSTTLFGYIFGTSSYKGGLSFYQYYSSSDYCAYYIPRTLVRVTVLGGNLLYGAFYNCYYSITNITLGDQVTSIGDYAIYRCSALTNAIIGNSVTSIGNYAFYSCDGLKNVTIGENVTSIGNSAFGTCRNLTSVVIPNKVTSIGSYAFDTCSNMTSVTISDHVTSIENGVFKACSKLTDTTIPSSVTSIGDYAFYNCTSLTTVIIPNSVTSVGNYAFSYCTNLASVTIGNHVTTIGNNVFTQCKNLTSITIPSSVTSIGSNTFYGCSGLANVYFENTSGWWCALYATSTFGTSISSSDLSNPATAATYLTNTYASYYLNRS